MSNLIALDSTDPFFRSPTKTHTYTQTFVSLLALKIKNKFAVE